MKWSKEQELAIKASDRSLLVSAAAGSGKTTTLAARCAHLTSKEKDPCDVTQLLVVTFTDAAAAEMRFKIGEALREKHAAACPKDAARIGRQRELLPSAQISTIHAFCSRLIRQNFQFVGLDPEFRLLDENEASLLKRETITAIFEEQFAAGFPSDFSRLIDLYADANDQRIQDQVIHVHDLLCSLPDPEAWRSKALQRLEESAGAKDWSSSEIGKELSAYALRLAKEASRAVGAMLQVLKDIPGSGGHVKVADAVIARLETVSDQLERGNWEQAGEAMLEENPRLTSDRNCSDKELCKELLAHIRKTVAKDGELAQCLSRRPEEMIAQAAATLPSARAFLGLVEEFGDRYEQAKREANTVDFSDLEHIALRLLRSSEYPVAAQTQARFRYVMIDEFQDVNRVQWEIISRVSRRDGKGQPANLFCVGDVKQSIYRFRMADSAIFQERSAEWSSAGQVLAMTANYRSRSSLLDCINTVFRTLMPGGASEIHYTPDHRLVGKREFPAPAPGLFEGAPIELHVLPDGEASEGEDPGAVDLNRVQREAAYVAQWIANLLSEGRRIVERDGKCRELKPSDIAILLRSTRNTAIEYSRALAEHGVPCFAESRTGFFQTTETGDLLSVLRLLDNMRQDIPLAAVLRNPVIGPPDPENAMAKIRAAYRRDPFHVAVWRYATEKTDDLAKSLSALRQRLEVWRKASLTLSVADLLWQILTETSYFAFCAALPNGRQRTANVLFLHRCARKFSQFHRQGLFRFMQFLKELEDKSDLGQPSPGEAGNAVQVMTVHGAKGLEFPVVILSDIGRKFNNTDSSGHILADRKAYLGLSVADEGKFVRYPSVASLLVKEAIKSASLAEELRVLYVAMTRAQEKLVLVGSAKQKAVERLEQTNAGPGLFASAGCILDWMVPLAATYPDQVSRPKAPLTKSDHQPAPLLDAPVDAEPAFSIDLPGPYAHGAATVARAANSVTGLSKGDEKPAHFGFDASDDATDGGGSATQEEAKARGITVHRFMELIDLGAPSATLGRQLASLQAAEKFSAAEAALINLSDVCWFLEQTPAGRLIQQHAASAVREIPMLDTAAADGMPSTAPLDRMLIRGRIDAVIETPDGLHVIDYKTDGRFPEAGSPTETAYRSQMGYYRDTLNRSGFGKVAGVHLVFLRARQVLSL